AIDHRLTKKQMDELRACSSRAQITPSSFVNVYNWGDLKGNPARWMEKYFDAFLYVANWGTRWFMLRVPEKLLDQQVAAPYCSGESFSCRRKDDRVILSFQSEDEDHEGEGGEGMLASIIPVRADLMHGDHRALYLGWLLAVQSGEIDADVPEPLVPPGLGDLNASLAGFADFLRIDDDLIAAAAERSPRGVAPVSKAEIDAWVRNLPGEEKDALLARLVDGEAQHLAAELHRRVREMRSAAGPAGSPRRTAGEIMARAQNLAEARKKKETEQRARDKVKRALDQAEKRKKHLASLVGKEEILWVKVASLIAARQTSCYDEAVSLLQDLQALADREGKSSEFSRRMTILAGEHTRKPALTDRFRKAKLGG
ncbi:MAG: hypothetical protein V2A78_04785, partial [bacterium]